MEVICAILTALFGIGFGIFMALQPEDAIALHDRGRYTQTEPTEAYIKLTRLEGIVAVSYTHLVADHKWNGKTEQDRHDLSFRHI